MAKSPKEWTNAITFSTEYINALPLASKANFNGIWTDANAEEVSFKLKRTATLGGRIGSLFRATSANANTIGTVTWVVSDKLWASYDQTNDIRFNSYLKDETLLKNADDWKKATSPGFCHCRVRSSLEAFTDTW